MFACALFHLLDKPPSPEIIREIINGAVNVEIDFVRASLPVKLIGMNEDDMSDYVKYVADMILMDLDQPKVFFFLILSCLGLLF